ncbi:MAG: 30S ribosomal protein S2 [Candidatus Jorgensenbacteria bacterium GW2011_GWA2_45_9]|uniref:Small ribosomal subunit protein uS2 n=1 Tax=Candidatus Jorgensenbacteria bacterium GW2011_GWA2_45_9 TaxID=1618663 RepID=A0A0G1QDJ6_9BACT|nr:MAG: 30S ribosomal protein S2 [Candidatus Jorgensenbacteria bacterium GW2011_GWA2_45_9]
MMMVDNTTISDELVREMVQNGVVIGHKKSKTHPKMKPFIAGNRNELEIMNPASAWNSLEAALEFLKDTVLKGGLVLFVATAPSSKKIIREAAQEFGYPFVDTRWLGGTLTNFTMLRTRVSYFEKLKERKEKGEFAKYSKKEQLNLDKETEKLSRRLSGLVLMKKLPDAVFVVDAEAHATAVKEANLLNIPVAAIVDTNDNPSLVSYPIFGNDHSRQSVEWIMGRVKDAMRQASVKAAEARAAKEESAAAGVKQE